MDNSLLEENFTYRFQLSSAEATFKISFSRRCRWLRRKPTNAALSIGSFFFFSVFLRKYFSNVHLREFLREFLSVFWEFYEVSHAQESNEKRTRRAEQLLQTKQEEESDSVLWQQGNLLHHDRKKAWTFAPGLWWWEMQFSCLSTSV